MYACLVKINGWVLLIVFPSHLLLLPLWFPSVATGFSVKLVRMEIGYVVVLQFVAVLQFVLGCFTYSILLRYDEEKSVG